MTVILWVLFGALAGWVAAILIDGDRRRTAVRSILLGVAGAVLGGAVSSIIAHSRPFDWADGNIINATAGSIILIFMGRLFNRIISDD